MFSCKNCPDRKPHCHSVCERYAAAKAEREDIAKKERALSRFHGYEISRYYKHKDNWNKKHRK